MFRKILSVFVVMTMVFTSVAFAAMSNESIAQYEAQKKKINDQIVAADRAQLAKLKEMKKEFKTKMDAMKKDGSSKADRKAFHQEYKKSVKEAKAQYKEQQKALRAQVKVVKDQQKEARVDAKAAKKAMKGKK